MSAPNKNYDPVAVTALSAEAVESAIEAALDAIAAATTLDQLKEARLAHVGDRAPLWAARAEIGALPPEAKADAYADDRLPLLPRSLGAAIADWEATPFARETFGEHFADTYAGLARYDAALYDAAITDWETQRYREFA